MEMIINTVQLRRTERDAVQITKPIDFTNRRRSSER